MTSRRQWNAWAVQVIEADFNRSADTHLISVGLAGCAGISLYLKDESSHPTGSLKHRLARSLFLYALCNDWIGPDTRVIEASSGSTAVSEAYFAKLLGLPFTAVVPRSTAQPKLDAIRFHGGTIHMVDDPRRAYDAAQTLARQSGGHYMDQFTYAERATDWRGNNNIAQSIFDQMAQEEHSVPAWIVCGAGTGGTSASIGRFLRYRRYPTRLCVADPEHSVFHRHFDDQSCVELPEGCTSGIEGIGRARVEPSFVREVIDRMTAVNDSRSIGAMRALSTRLGRRVGGSTGTNLWACAMLAEEMARAGERGSIVSLICDAGERYSSTYYDDHWLGEHGIDWRDAETRMLGFLTAGPPPFAARAPMAEANREMPASQGADGERVTVARIFR